MLFSWADDWFSQYGFPVEGKQLVFNFTPIAGIQFIFVCLCCYYKTAGEVTACLVLMYS